jgi:hypothetical protein
MDLSLVPELGSEGIYTYLIRKYYEFKEREAQ